MRKFIEVLERPRTPKRDLVNGLLLFVCQK
jgi:hypothetical protein